ncbi:hypothetical protein, conserved [Entamoeba dispar SAW760]|uniref:Leucine rich repeat containing protein BspA family protein n=1 Tax=Entamoeba dispar (strain ATCC PRA-260 / SAW760) TaxID=370354 RepID=B0E5U7_ENTDS|nr:uncharacterized protein EDI_112600 [Entamoeba dispar SAW760]EDR30065.1 hypothetical protein, conserved [Entamoeba dispar SAW760]|eukprot:EDR30065.1 hypothetical protein, conserved [Entamoeba dispar SAW760]
MSKKLDGYSLMIVSKYFITKDDYKKVVLVCKKFKDTIDKFRYNPIPIYDLNFFRNIETQFLYYPFEEKIPSNHLLYRIKYYVPYYCYLENKKKWIHCDNVMYTKKDFITFGSSIPVEVKKIGKECFSETDTVELMQIPNTVIELQRSCFKSCISLKTIILSTNIKSIPFCSFANCQSLKEIVLPESVTMIGAGCFYACQRLEKIKLPSNLSEIGNQAFCYCTSLQSITIPSNINRIPLKCFSFCFGLSTVVNLGNLIEIGSSAFESCTGLRTIDLPNSLKFIGGGAFLNCSSLVHLIIPHGVANISINSFKGCSAITEFDVPRDPNGDYPFEISTSELPLLLNHGISPVNINVSGPNDSTKLNIPLTPSILGKRCFSGNTKLESYWVPSSIIHLDEECFSDCSQLTSIYFPNSVTVISPFAFSNCINLKKVVLPKYSINTIQRGCFFNCSKLVSIDIPYSVTEIYERAFDNCSSLKKLNIPPSVRKIKSEAFNRCTSLSEIIIPSSVTQIAPNCFNGCVSIKNIYIQLDNEGFYPFDVSNDEFILLSRIRIKIKCIIMNTIPNNDLLLFNRFVHDRISLKAGPNMFTNTLLKEIVLPPCFISLSDMCFVSCKATKIVIPSTVTSIGENCFSKCTNLLSISLPNKCKYGSYIFKKVRSLTSITINGPFTGIVSIEEAYYLQRCGVCCTNISLTTKDYKNNISLTPNITGLDARLEENTQIIIPSHITRIGIGCFGESRISKSFIFPSSIKEIGNELFESCYELEHVDCSSLNSIPKFCFFNNRKLSSVVLSSQLEKIKSGAFYQCCSLTSVTIPSSVTKIGYFVFYQCQNLKEVIFEKNSKLKTISQCLFYKCYSLTKLVLPEVNNIDNLSIFKTLSLKEIEIPSTVTRLGVDAFKRSGQLSKIILHEGLKVIDKECFMYCSSLESIKIPNSVTALFGGVFCSCCKLTSVTLSSNLQIVETNCFEGCCHLTRLVINEQPIYEYNYPISFTQANYFEIGFIQCSHIIYTENDRIVYGKDIPQSVQELGDNCFREVSINKISLPSSITKIGAFCFKDCFGLIEFESLAEHIIIGDYAFDSCVSLRQMKLPKNVMYGENITYKCDSLKK